MFNLHVCNGTFRIEGAVVLSVNHFSSDVTVNCLKRLSVGCFAALRGTP